MYYPDITHDTPETQLFEDVSGSARFAESVHRHPALSGLEAPGTTLAEQTASQSPP